MAVDRPPGRRVVRSKLGAVGVILLLALIILGVIGAVVAAHAHDTSAAALYDRQCPMQDATGRVAAVAVIAPVAAPLAVTGAVMTWRARRAAVAAGAPAPSRAPPSL